MTMFALGVTGCSPLPATSSAKSSYVPGAYTAQAQGKQSLGPLRGDVWGMLSRR